jgi:hypothetical protein
MVGRHPTFCLVGRGSGTVEPSRIACHQGPRDVGAWCDRPGLPAHDSRRVSSGGAVTTSSVAARVSPT